MIYALILALLLCASPALAAEKFTVTYSDEMLEALDDALVRYNARIRDPAKRKTRADYVQIINEALAGEWDKDHAHDAALKNPQTRTNRERRILCKKAGLESCPGVK